jgi:hypothetical protein
MASFGLRNRSPAAWPAPWDIDGVNERLLFRLGRSPVRLPHPLGLTPPAPDSSSSAAQSAPVARTGVAFYG